jgi:CBS-domain-containing membrane protein
MTLPKPTAAFQVSLDTPISECVSLMNEHKIGSLLVRGRETDGTIVGIFTERDLLRNISLIQTHGYWHFPISSVMSTPVVTLDARYLDRAATLMLDHGFRHLPIIETQESGAQWISGIISIRDVLQARFAQETPPVSGPRRRIAVQVRGSDPRTSATLLSILRKLVKGAELATSDDPKFLPADYTLALMDADGMKPPEIARTLVETLEQETTHTVFLFYSPHSLPAQTLASFEGLKATGKLELFPKPLNLVALSDALGRHRIGN